MSVRAALYYDWTVHYDCLSNMNKNEFKERVISQSKLPPEILKQAIEAHLDIYGTTEKEDVARCIQFAGILEEAEKNAQPILGKPPRSYFVMSELVAESIRPDVETIREHYFGNPSVPFKSKKSALAWLNQMEEPFPGTQGSKRFPGFDFYKEEERLTRTQGIRVKIRAWLPSITFADNDFAVFYGQALYRLAVETYDIADNCDFGQEGVVNYVLLGKKPLLNFFTIKTRRSPVIDKSNPPYALPLGVTININSIDLNEQQFRDLWKTMRSLFDKQHKKQLSQRQLILFGVVTSLGGGPAEDETKTEFWTRVQQEFNRRIKRGQKYKDWQGPRKAYLRLIESHGMKATEERRRSRQ